MILASSLILHTTASAQEAPVVTAQVHITPQEITLGEPVQVTVTVMHSENSLITVEPPMQTSALKLLATLPSQTATLPDGSFRTETRFTVTAFELGPQQLTAFRILWLRSDGSSGELSVNPEPFAVESALTTEPTQLRPLKPQATFSRPPSAWVPTAVVSVSLLLITILVILIAYRRLRRTLTRLKTPDPNTLTPEATARQRLEELAAANSLANQNYEHFYGTLSIVVRNYLEERFKFAATALTTSELDREMTGHGVERWQARLTCGLLDRCDDAIYARRFPDPRSADHDLTVAFEIIELSQAQYIASTEKNQR
jgi:hypothetical protein